MVEVVHVVVTDNFAGVERHVAVLANEQFRQGLSVAVLGGHEVHMRGELREDVEHRAVRNIAETISALRRRGRTDIFHAHMTAAESACLAASLGTGVPVVATRHFAAPRAHRAGPLARAVIRRSLAAQIAVSQFVEREVDGRSTVIYAGVEDQPLVLHHERERFVLMAQRLDPEKDSMLGITAFNASGLAERGWKLLVAGAGRGRAQMEAEVSKLGLSTSVEFLGFRSDVLELMRRCSIFLATAPAEPFGLSVAEAMASGTPVVAAAGGGHLESVGAAVAENLFPQKSVTQAAALLAKLGDRGDLRDKTGLVLRQTQQRLFQPSKQARQTSDVYAGVLR